MTTTDKLARGATTVRTTIQSFLADDLPPLIVKARTDWELEDWQLPEFKAYNTYDPIVVTNGQFPFLGASVVRTPQSTRFEQDHQAQNKFRVRYSVRVFVWARTAMLPDESWEQGKDPEQFEATAHDSAMRIRDDLVAVVRQSILATSSFGTADEDYNHLLMNSNTLTVEYFPTLKMGSQGPRWSAGASINFDVDATEGLWQPRIDGPEDNIITITGEVVGIDKEL